MNNLLRLSVILFFILFTNALFAQNTTLTIGSWRDHTPYNNGIVFCASQFGLFSYNKNNGELITISRLDQLSDLELSTIRFDNLTNVLLIAYGNSNIDLIFSDKTIVNLPDIKQKNIIGGKQINCIFFLNGYAYLGCGFGIVVVDIKRKEIKDTYYIGPNGTNLNVNGIAFDGISLLAATDDGIYKADYNDPDIYNYTSWNKDTTLTEPNATYTSATSLNGKFYVVKTNIDYAKDTVLVYSNNQWQPFFSDAGEGGFVDSYNNMILYRNDSKVSAFDENATQLREVNIFMYNNANIKRGLLDSGGNFWVADFNNGLVWQKWDNSLQFISPNGPRSAAVWSMAGSKGVLWVASGALSGDAPNYNLKTGIYRFSENRWNTYDCSNDAIYGQLCASGSPAVICVAIDPSDPNHAFVGSWGNGLLEYRKDGGVNRYTESNSSLLPVNLIPGYILVGGVTFDDDGNLWVVAGGNTNAISVLKPGGAWQNFVIPEIAVSAYGLYSLVVDDYGQKWFIARSGSSVGEGLCVFKERDLNNPNNAYFKRLSDDEGYGALPHIFVRSIAKDKDGSIWIGTDKGVGVVYNPGNVFSGAPGSYDAQKIIIEQDGYNQYLLETEIVSAIAIDGANRKWFGTYSGGVFLMSPDGTKQIYNFNKDNSPLPSNSITSIAIDDLTGEVFFGTDKGIISYRADATEGGEACSDYYVFPNPIRHDYSGPIAIRGLLENADVKITDVAGNLVYHLIANGGEAIWNGTNFEGKRVQTGIYIVMVTNEDGTQTCSTKMLFAN
jgi:Two component regulator propeller